RALIAIVACVCAWTIAALAEAQALATDPGELLLHQLEDSLNGKDVVFRSLFLPEASELMVDSFRKDLVTPGSVRTVVRERDRAQLEGAPEGDGFRLVVEV